MQMEQIFITVQLHGIEVAQPAQDKTPNVYYVEFPLVLLMFFQWQNRKFI